MSPKNDGSLWTDSHCHLAMADFDGDRAGAIERAKAFGVKRLVSVGTNPGDWDEAAALANGDDIVATAGLHPHEASKWNGDVAASLASALGRPSVRAVGEIGLDFHYDISPREVQIEAFAAQLAIAQERGLPPVIHSREAFDKTVDVLRGLRWSAPGIIHCFTYGEDKVKPFLDLGFTISVSGIVTFPRAEELRSAVKCVPIGRLLVETDSPYLAPVPFRGKRCEPAHVARVGEFLAGCLQIAPEELALATSSNAAKLFAWPAP